MRQFSTLCKATFITYKFYTESSLPQQLEFSFIFKIWLHMLSGLFFLQRDISDFTSVHCAEYTLYLCSDLYSHSWFQSTQQEALPVSIGTAKCITGLLHSAFTQGRGFITHFMSTTLLCVQLWQMQKEIDLYGLF